MYLFSTLTIILLCLLGIHLHPIQSNNSKVESCFGLFLSRSVKQVLNRIGCSVLQNSRHLIMGICQPNRLFCVPDVECSEQPMYTCALHQFYLALQAIIELSYQQIRKFIKIGVVICMTFDYVILLLTIRLRWLGDLPQLLFALDGQGIRPNFIHLRWLGELPQLLFALDGQGQGVDSIDSVTIGQSQVYNWFIYMGTDPLQHSGCGSGLKVQARVWHYTIDSMLHLSAHT